uniref:THAP-type domain-containing protein n=1 Tax=Clytia hemisphaerica TaxID=252671 RepID=A0A7M5WQG4_9CNID
LLLITNTTKTKQKKNKNNLKKMVRTSGTCCVFPGCPVYSGLPQYKGVSLFKLPSKAIDRDWKKQLVDIIKKYRVVDKCLQSRIDESKVWLCSLHFTESDFEYTRTGLRKLKLFALPTENLPKKSFEKEAATVRRQLVRDPLPLLVSDPNPTAVVENVYESFDEFVSYCSKWELPNWKVLSTADQSFVTYRLENSKFSIPKFEIIVNTSLEFTVRLYGWYLPDNHNLYKRHKRSLRKVSLYDLYDLPCLYNV